MTNLDFAQVELQQLITHHVGNKLRDEKTILSSEVSIIADDTKEILLKYFLQPLKAEEFFAFSHAVKLDLNEIYSIVGEMFSSPESFINSSQSIARLLYEQSNHPKIK